ncbi:MAG: ribonuclease III [Oscillospiraceae bacterium]|jgi:ribonuclease-3 family protein|nr:ribonuclease III [Oscillospiraceae bacterium]
MNYFDMTLTKSEINGKNILALSHLGDGVYELAVRTFLCADHTFTNRSLHLETLKYVSASAQAKAFTLIEDMLSEEERATFLRGRNARIRYTPKSCSKADYHTATGLEALMGALYLGGSKARICELLDRIFENKELFEP